MIIELIKKVSEEDTDKSIGTFSDTIVCVRTCLHRCP